VARATRKPADTLDVPRSDGNEDDNYVLEVEEGEEPYTPMRDQPDDEANNANSDADFSDEDVMDFIFIRLLGIVDKDHPLRQAFKREYITNASDWSFITDHLIANLQRPVTSRTTGPTLEPVPALFKEKAACVRDYLNHLYGSNGYALHNNYFRDHVTQQDFMAFIKTHRHRAPAPTTGTQVSPLKSPGTATTSSSSKSSAADISALFKKTLKRDKSNYLELKDEKNWDHFQRHLIIQAHADGIEKQLDASYVPKDADEAELDRLEGKYFMSVLNHVLKTDKGKTIVRKHIKTFNARQAYDELVTYMTKSTKAKMTNTKLLNFVVSARFGENTVSTTAEHFILTFREKLRLLDERTPVHQHMPDAVRLALLQNAVAPVEALRNVQTTAELAEATGGNTLDFATYFTLLESAAQTYDEEHKKDSKPKRNINIHDTSPENLEEDTPDFFDIHEGDVDQVMQVHKAFQQRRNNDRSNKDKPKFQSNGLPYIPYEVWKQLDQAARDLLRNFDPATVKDKGNARAVNIHEIEQYLEQLDSSPVDKVDDSNPLLAMATGQTNLDAGDIRNVLSAHKAQQSKPSKEIVVDGITYRSINITYRVTQSTTSNVSGSLIDRGANGGLLGDDALVLEKTGRKVDVAGLDQHTVNDLEIVTAAGFV